MDADSIKLSKEIEEMQEACLKPTRKWGKSTLIWLAFLILIAGWGFFCFIYQL